MVKQRDWISIISQMRRSYEAGSLRDMLHGLRLHDVGRREGVMDEEMWLLLWFVWRVEA